MSNGFSGAKRQLVLNKTAGRCAYCGTPLDHFTLCVDHIIPRALGGSHHLSNLHASCRTCNTAKGVRCLEDFRLHTAALAAIGSALFSAAQLRYLNERGLLDSLGVDSQYQFFFERAQ